jgi:AraC family transcriptional regulator of adaptative response/methylated-DNA-[protein]-cysteine methyltransferase
MSDYQRIEKAINYILEQSDSQPSLEEIAASVHLSPFHFLRLFSQWLGVTPKRFLQTLTVERAKALLAQSKPLLEVSDLVGLSSASRLHDHFVKLEAVTPGEYKTGGQGMSISYGLHETPFGKAFIALTDRGICKVAFLGEGGASPELDTLKAEWKHALIQEDNAVTGKAIESLFSQPATEGAKKLTISLFVRGTNFQVQVWQALLQIPQGSLSTYSDIAAAVGKPKAARAAGSAIGANPVAFAIPCHRVIQQSGGIGGYRWGTTRKHAIHAWESARAD